MPHPFSNPGDQAKYLTTANLPPSRLDVPTPKLAGLSDTSATLLAHELATAMVNQSVPAIAQPARRGDWWLQITAQPQGGNIVPHYALMTPKNQMRAERDGTPVSAAQWTLNDPLLIKTMATEAAPAITDLLTGVQASLMQQDPNSLMHRPSKTCFEGVQGAPGDGNVALGRAFYSSFPNNTDTIQTDCAKVDFIIRGVAKLTTLQTPPSTQQIEIAWRVRTPKGDELGAATQIHAIPAHSLDGPWGDTALSAASEAAEAVHTIITNYSGRTHTPLPAPASESKNTSKGT
ncbi:hypothetical protein AA106555_1562 [Neokomagataea thailandica NBRC 106555]|nr:hypothetical protein AA106555_1562 [Neokomagataea thailandica NBRC 106555]